jgi:hypothetical protein
MASRNRSSGVARSAEGQVSMDAIVGPRLPPRSVTSSLGLQSTECKAATPTHWKHADYQVNCQGECHGVA